MNKNTKKFVVTLLSVLMVLSFMPTMAFAGTKEPDDPSAHDWDEATYLKEKDCSTGEYYVAQQKCLGANGLDCAATKTELKTIAWTDHTFHKEFVSVPVALVAAAMNPIVGGGDFDVTMFENTIKWFANNRYCRVEVQVCDNCGLVNIYLQPNGTRYKTQKRNATGAYVNVGDDFVTEHSTKPFACMDKYTCEFCDMEVESTPTAPHTPDPDKTIVKTNVCGSGENAKVTITTCKDCGAVEYSYSTGWTATAHDGIGDGISETDYNKLSDAEKALYIKVGTKYYKYNKVTKEPTCKATGTGVLVCSECGKQVGGTVTLPMVDHHYETLTTEATCTKPQTTTKFCLTCGEEIKTTVGQPKAHSYKKTVYAEPTCFWPGLTVIECTECGQYEYVPGHMAHLENAETDPKKDPEYFFTGFKGELKKTGSAAYADCIPVDDWAQKQHDLGDYEHALDPTCTDGEILARKCAVDGTFYAHDVKEVGKALGHEVKVTTVKATCGTWGYSYKSCTRCKALLFADGKYSSYYNLTALLTDYEYDYAELEDDGYIFDLVKPLVADGAECTFEWKVTKVPTATEDGEKALVCTKCNAVKDGSQTVVPKDSDEAKNAVIAAEADPAIEAASTVIADKANYKADSVKAIEEARALLNQAIAAGTAADVSREAAKLQAAVNAAEKKDANPMTAKGKTVKSTSKKTKTFKAKKAFTVKKAQGKVTYKKANKKGGAKIKVAKNGKVTVKKGLKKGTYKVKVKVTAAGNGNYFAKTKSVTLTVKITK